MPDLVVDCSVAAQWVLPGNERDEALRLLEQYESGEVRLIAPDLLLAEFSSLLAKRTRRKQLSAEQAGRAFELMKQCAPRLYEMTQLLDPALQVAMNTQVSLWDAVYVALALEHHCSLITADQRLFRAGKGRHPVIRLLSPSRSRPN